MKPVKRTFAPLKPLDLALTELLSHAIELVGIETASTFDADGRILAADVVSGLQVPANDNSAMDGYALRCSDIPTLGTVLPVSQRIAAGAVPHALQAGTVARIFTGAVIPKGADAVVMQESCEVVEDISGINQICVNEHLSLGMNIRRAGEDVTLGAVVLPKGERLTPASLGLAASIGMASLPVVRRPKVALFSTGDELVMPGDIAPENMPAGSIYNSNRFFLRAMLQRLGCEVTDLGIVPDKLEATKFALQNAANSHDLILTSGGVSVGEEDHIKPAVQSLGELNLWQVAIKPGKPFAYGKVMQTHFIGLPGNPVSSFVTFMLLVRPFILKLQGAQHVDIFATQSIAMRADFTMEKPEKRREFLRVKRNENGGLDLFPNQSSGVLTSAVWGDGLVNNPAGQTIATGDMVQYTAFSEVLS